MAGVENNEMNTYVNQEEHDQYPVIGYSPIPRCVLKEEPESEGDQDECNEEMLHLMAYPPLPHGDIKEESEEGENRDEFIFCDELAYPPLPHGDIKEELEVEENLDEFISSGEQPMTPQGGNPDQRNHEPAAQSGSSAMPLVDSSATDNENYTEPLRTKKKKRTMKGVALSAGTLATPSGSDHGRQAAVEIPRSSRILRSHGRSNRMVLDGVTSRKPTETEELQVPESDEEIDEADEYSSLEDVDQSDDDSSVIDDDYDPYHSAAGPSTTTKKTVGKRPKEKGPKTLNRPVHPFKCHKCGNTYKQNTSLKRHLKYACDVDPSHQCTFCVFRAALKDDLRKHLMRVHKVERSQLSAFGAAVGSRTRPDLPFKCKNCKRSYKNKNHLNQHLTYECGVDRRFHCPHCDHRTSRKENLKRHVSDVHDVTGFSGLVTE